MFSFESYIDILETADTGLAAKAKKSGVSIGTLRKVYKRGMAAWNSGHRPGTTPQQWGMARVNSYIAKGSGTYGGADKDLREEVDAVESLTSSLHDPSSYDAIDQMMQTIAKDCGISPKQLRDSFMEKHGKTPDDYAKGVQEAATVPKDKESGLPKKYVAGLSKSTAKARAAHFAAADKLSDSDPRAYEPAPGDANAKTKESKYTKKYRAMYGEDIDEEIYEACWDSHKQVGMKKKGDKMVPDCVPKNEEVVDEGHQVVAKTKQGETMKSGVYPTKEKAMSMHYKMSKSGQYKSVDTVKVEEVVAENYDLDESMADSWKGVQSMDKGSVTGGKAEVKKHLTYLNAVHDHHKKFGNDTKKVRDKIEGIKRSRIAEDISADEQFDLIEELVMDLAEQHNIDPETLWEKFNDDELLEAAVDAKGHKSSTGGLTQKGRDSYNRQSGGNLKAPVTTKPSELKAGSKAANRRKSFCARMSGMEGAMKKPNGEPTRKALALRKWNC